MLNIYGGECFRIVTNIITIRGLDTISIVPSSKTDLECVGTDALIRREEKYVYSRKKSESTEKFSDKSARPFSTDFYGECLLRRTIPGTGCKNYLDYEEFTHMFVDDILKAAVDVITKKYRISVKFDRGRLSSYRNIVTWPTIDNFDVDLGMTKIREYIDCTSEMTENWKYSIELIAIQSNKVSDFYKYEVKFAIPTQCFPVAQATASVYFTYEVSRVKPRHCFVDVTFQIETSRCVLIPGKNYITEKLLLRVIDIKIAYFKTVEV